MSEPQGVVDRVGHWTLGGDGIQIFARDWGRADAPAMLLIHEFGQSHAAWIKQFQSPLLDRFRLVAMDMRGHGFSEKPSDPEAYLDGDMFAEDVAAVIEAFGLDKPVLVGWSFGGIVIGDYLARYGDSGISGVVTAGAVFQRGDVEAEAENAERASRKSDALDFDTFIEAIRIAARCAQPAEPEAVAEPEAPASGISLTAPPHVRRALRSRVVDHAPTYRALTKPHLIIHGENDETAPPDWARRFAALAPTARVRLYPGVGHRPFYEDADRFNADLAAFMERNA